MDGSPSFGQAQRRVNGHEVGPRVPDRVKNVLVAERNVCRCAQAAQEAHASRPAWRTGEIDTDNDQRCTGRHNGSGDRRYCSRTGESAAARARGSVESDRVGTPSPSAGRPRCGGIITEKENIPFVLPGVATVRFTSCCLTHGRKDTIMSALAS